MKNNEQETTTGTVQTLFPVAPENAILLYYLGVDPKSVLDNGLVTRSGGETPINVWISDKRCIPHEESSICNNYNDQVIPIYHDFPLTFYHFTTGEDHDNYQLLYTGITLIHKESLTQMFLTYQVTMNYLTLEVIDNAIRNNEIDIRFEFQIYNKLSGTLSQHYFDPIIKVGDSGNVIP